ncbi:hypothetical protein HG15A2_23620 [Adhaeretor mobilis]|uniref:Sialate O-acetylesterase domain-containing protein n=2 Tax=Adhaeretor mobilis TaxID=1930276 RepID=A0A517MW10_9BACT|nr:hypothetical protein HG15A2_23620 [Adhaeretor mobilis]
MVFLRAIAFIVILAGASLSQAKCFDIYILTGQSNSLGTTELEGTASAPGTHPADVHTAFYWSNVAPSSSDPNNITLYGDSAGSLTKLIMQQGDGVNPNFWGPEFGFSRKLFEAGRSNVLVIKVSRGGGGNRHWLPTTGHMTNHLLKQIDIALASIRNSGDTFKIKGLMYLQGESNNDDEAALADTRLQTLVDCVQSHINADYPGTATSMYTVVGELASSKAGATRVKTTALQNSLARGKSKVGFCETNDLPLKSDAIHFGRDAKLEIGRRFADAFISREWVENPLLIAGYSANQGVASPHPVAQGFSQKGNVTGVVMEGIADSGTLAWRIRSDNQRGNTEYRRTLTPIEFQRMLARGWKFKVRTKVLSGSGSVCWSITKSSDPGWSIANSGIEIGFHFTRINDAELEVRIGGNKPAINLVVGSADQYHSFELRGKRLSNQIDLYIDGQLRRDEINLQKISEVSSSADALVFSCGSKDDVASEVYWNEVSIFVLD